VEKDVPSVALQSQLLVSGEADGSPRDLHLQQQHLLAASHDATSFLHNEGLSVKGLDHITH
jgi:hypothetical protein